MLNNSFLQNNDCYKKINNYNDYLLKIRSAHFGSIELYNFAKDLFINLLYSEYNIIDFGDLNNLNISGILEKYNITELPNENDFDYSINKTLYNFLSMLISKNELELFKSLDILNNYLSETNYINDINKLKEIDITCDKKSVISSDFLNINKINYNIDNKIKLNSFITDKITSQINKEIRKIEIRYNKYLIIKNELIKRMKNESSSEYIKTRLK